MTVAKDIADLIKDGYRLEISYREIDLYRERPGVGYVVTVSMYSTRITVEGTRLRDTLAQAIVEARERRAYEEWMDS